MIGIIQNFTDEAVAALHNSSPYKIRGDKLMKEDEEFEEVLKEIDIEQFLREMELRQLKGAQILKQWDDDEKHDKFGDETGNTNDAATDHVLDMF